MKYNKGHDEFGKIKSYRCRVLFLSKPYQI